MKKILLLIASLVLICSITFGQSVRTFDTAAELAALPVISAASDTTISPTSTVRSTVLLRGWSSAGDGKGGGFYWNPTSTATTNTLTVLQALGITTGRWLRMGTITAKSASNGSIGTAYLSSGSATFTNTSVTANTLIFLTSYGPTNSFVTLNAVNTSTGVITIKSNNQSDTNTVNILFVEPSP